MMKRPGAVAHAQTIGARQARADIGFRGFDRCGERKIVGEARSDRRRQRAAGAMRIFGGDARCGENALSIRVA